MLLLDLQWIQVAPCMLGLDGLPWPPTQPLAYLYLSSYSWCPSVIPTDLYSSKKYRNSSALLPRPVPTDCPKSLHWTGEEFSDASPSAWNQLWNELKLGELVSVNRFKVLLNDLKKALQLCSCAAACLGQDSLVKEIFNLSETSPG